jgi:hypothetical protein
VQKAYEESERIVGFLCVPCCYSKSKLVRDVEGYFITPRVTESLISLSEGSMLTASCKSDVINVYICFVLVF